MLNRVQERQFYLLNPVSYFTYNKSYKITYIRAVFPEVWNIACTEFSRDTSLGEPTKFSRGF
jgi:hypothetical protein